MSTKLIDEIYIKKSELEKEYKKELLDFLNGDKNTQFENAYSEVNAILKKSRWVPMEDGYCYDDKIKACWYGLYEKGHTYKKFNSSKNKDDVLNYFKGNYTTAHTFDLPTKTELYTSLAKLKSAPFNITKGRCSINCCVLYKNKNEIQGYNLDDNYWKDISSPSSAIPLIRLTKVSKSNISRRKVFFRWLILGLIPKELNNDSAYLKILKIFQQYEIEVENFFEIKGLILTDKKIQIFKSLLINKLLNEDKLRADLTPYNQKMLEDIEQGHWSLWNEDTNASQQDSIKAKLPHSLVARDPKSSIVNGTVGIDFGTKSTVVVYQKETTQIQPMRVGTGDLGKVISASHYENPTIMEFNDFEQFIKDYTNRDGRPFTKWEDLTISHTAYSNLLNSKSDFFNSFIGELKQWAGNKDKKLKIVDKKGFVLDLPTFDEMDEETLNPIEIYAYYLGLYINNQNNGIFLDYILSFPVTYEVSVREKIIQSFYKGLKKSLPQELHDQAQELKKLTVIQGASEPAAYAIVALEEYGFEPEGNEKIFYGVFDFGGGTTDFDFGIYREANGKKERRYDYVIEHFGAGGDRYLGGENLLELLAFEVFKQNKDILLENKIQFVKPPETKDFLGSEQLLSLSREAKMNTKMMMEILRPFWENDEEQQSVFESGVLNVNLLDVNAKQHVSFELDFNKDKMTEILKNRIDKGVKNFFHSLRLAFKNHQEILDEIEEINIFLAGNSSKSNILRELFDIEIEIENKTFKEELQSEKDVFKIYAPLDSGAEFDKPTGKTGVAFGLIETRKGGDILVIDHNVKDEKSEINFKYYLGNSRRKKFKVVINRDEPYNKWIEFIDASEDTFEVFYSSQSIVTTNKIATSDNSIKKVSLKIDNVNEDALVYIRLISPNEFEYVVALEDEIANEQYLGKINRVVL